MQHLSFKHVSFKHEPRLLDEQPTPKFTKISNFVTKITEAQCSNLETDPRKAKDDQKIKTKNCNATFKIQHRNKLRLPNINHSTTKITTSEKK